MNLNQAICNHLQAFEKRLNWIEKTYLSKGVNINTPVNAGIKDYSSIATKEQIEGLQSVLNKSFSDIASFKLACKDAMNSVDNNRSVYPLVKRAELQNKLYEIYSSNDEKKPSPVLIMAYWIKTFDLDTSTEQDSDIGTNGLKGSSKGIANCDHEY